MSILSQKQKVFGNIAALRTLTEGMPKLSTTSSFPSINNDGNSILFLTDLIKSLVGYEALQEVVQNVLIFSLSNIENEIKSSIKDELKSIVNCGVNPSIPDFLKSNSNGINIELKKIDFTNLFLINPTTVEGSLLYNDVRTNLLESTDLNTFLYQVIQNNGTYENWGSQTLNENILMFKFKDKDVSGVNKNNTLTIKTNQSFDNKSLTDLNNSMINSLELFNVQNLISSIVDNTFGTISSSINKTLTQLQSEIRLNSLITKITNLDNNDIMNDDFFTFSKAEKLAQEKAAKLKMSGVQLLNTSTVVPSMVSLTSLSSISNTIKNSVSLEDKKNAFSSSIDLIGNQISKYSINQSDIKPIKLNFIQEVISNINKSIIQSLLSPKIVLIFLLNYRIIYGENVTYEDSIDFIKKNRNLIHNISKSVTNSIVKSLLSVVLKKVTELVSDSIIREEIEKAKANTAQLLSLFGVPSETLRIIKGLS